jgi:hypothetical protein
MEVNMRKILLSGFFIVIFVSISACNLAWQNGNPTPFFPTPNYTMTALFSVDANMPTNIPQDFFINTDVPLLPTVQPTSVATEVPAQALPTNTAFPTVVPPTNTSLPPASTKTEMPARGGTWVSGKYMKNPPVFDSVWDEWEATKYPAKHVVFGAGQWKNSDDLEGSFAVAWNETYLYLAVKVIDDVYAQNATGQDIYKGDSIEILLDTNLYGDLSTTSLNSDDFQIGISPGKGSINDETEAYLWYPSSKAGGLSDVIIASTGSDGVYRVEIGIPWKVFNITPSSGQQFGFGLSISDNDDTSQNIQQSMVSNLPNRRLVNPTTWTILTLVK